MSAGLVRLAWLGGKLCPATRRQMILIYKPAPLPFCLELRPFSLEEGTLSLVLS